MTSTNPPWILRIAFVGLAGCLSSPDGGSPQEAPCASWLLQGEQWISVGSDPRFAYSEGFSIGLWFKLSDGVLPESDQHLISRLEHLAGSGYSLELNRTSEGYAPLLAVVVEGGAGENLCRASGLGTLVTPGRWTHLGGVFTGASAKLFVDGALIRSEPCIGSATVFCGGVTVGRAADRLEQYAVGSISEVTFSSATLDSATSPSEFSDCRLPDASIFVPGNDDSGELTDLCGATVAGHLGNDSDADATDPLTVEGDCPEP